MNRLLPALLMSCLAAPALAQAIYACTDNAGGKVYSTSRDYANCKMVPKAPDAVVPPAATVKPRAAQASPADFPRVQENAQKARDNDRRHILDQELANEQRNLDLARRDLAEQEALRASADRLAPYRDRIAQHERNIAAIQKELAASR